MKIRSIKVIAMFDILGTKKRLERIGIDGLLDDYIKLTDFVQKQKGCLCVSAFPTGDGSLCPAVGYLETEQAYFSDTFLLWAEYESFRISAFFQICSDLFCYSLSQRIPLRGGIGVGDAHMDKKENIFLGQALVDAAEVESVQIWLGISCGQSFNQKPYTGPFDPRCILAYSKHQNPAKNYQVPGLVLDWPRRWRDTQKGDVKLLIESLNVDPQYENYYKNTLSFVDFSKASEDWYLNQHSLKA